MAVYVDLPLHRLGRMRMSHMVADTSEELLAMASRIGVKRCWLQHANEPGEHFDVCIAKRKLAVAAGAVEVSSREIVGLIRERRARKGER